MAIEAEEVDPLPSANVRAASYYIARTHVACPHCGAITPLTGVALGAGHETLEEACEEWQAAPANAFLFFLEAVSQAVQERLYQMAANVRFNCYWANHCEHCERILDDHDVHGEPGRGFTPLSEAEAAHIVLTEVAEPFEASAAGYSLEPEFFACMLRG
jgi:hypothetical protein